MFGGIYLYVLSKYYNNGGMIGSIVTKVADKTISYEKAVSYSGYYIIRIKESKPTFRFILSGRDISYNDSIITMVSSKKTFEPQFKKWRKAKLVYNDEVYKIKYKFHGQDPKPYKNGHVSLRVKSKRPIMGRRDFRLITGYEMNYTNVFLNSMAGEYDLIHEDAGLIVSARFGNIVEDFYMYESLEKSYYDRVYGSEMLYKFSPKGDFHTNSHSDPIDKYYYALDNSISTTDDRIKLGFVKYMDVRNGTAEFNADEQQYLGDYLSLVYLFGHPHQITGDNDKWLLDDNILLPIFRNEGWIIFQDPARNVYDQSLFDIYLPDSPNTMAYKYLVKDDKIRQFRNKNLYQLTLSREKILLSYDSLFVKYCDITRTYNQNYLRISLKHNIHKDNINKSLDGIIQYLNINEVHLLHRQDTIRLVSDSYVRMELIVNGLSYGEIEPREYQIDNDILLPHIREHTIPFSGKINKISIVNTVTGDTLAASAIGFIDVN
jgi:hypothetical protein